MNTNAAVTMCSHYRGVVWRSRRSGWTSLLASALLVVVTADATPTATDQRTPGLADTPGTQSSVPAVALALRDGYPNVEQDLTILDSDVLLKAYYFANSPGPIDHSAILTQNTENIVEPKPVLPTRIQAQSIERLVKYARQHPQLLIRAHDVALDPYDPVTRTYAISNRLFIPGARYYFDNSAYHYVFRGADAFHSFKVTSPGLITAINAAIGRYEHFSVDIACHVAGAEAKGSTLQLEVDQVTLKAADGSALMKLSKGVAVATGGARP